MHVIDCSLYLSDFLEIKFRQGVEPVRHLTDIEELHLKTETQRRNSVQNNNTNQLYVTEEKSSERMQVINIYYTLDFFLSNIHNIYVLTTTVISLIYQLCM